MKMICDCGKAVKANSEGMFSMLTKPDGSISPLCLECERLIFDKQTTPPTLATKAQVDALTEWLSCVTTELNGAAYARAIRARENYFKSFPLAEVHHPSASDSTAGNME